MAAALLNVIAFGLSGVTIIPFLSSLLAPPEDQITTVRLKVGQGVNHSEQFDGNTPGVALWNRFGNAIGSTFGSSTILAEGASTDIIVVPNPGVGNGPAEYISITNGGNNAICIAGFTVTFADGSNAGWTADVAAACPDTGALVYLSSSKVVSPSSGQDTVQPHCVWIDRDGSGGIPHQGFGVHLPDFGNMITENLAISYQNTPDLMCKSGPRFRMYEKLRTEDPILVFSPPINFNADGIDPDPSLIINNPGVLADQDQLALFNACGSKDKPPNCSQLSLVTPINTAGFKRAEQTNAPLYRRTHQRQYSSLGQHFDRIRANKTATNASAPSQSPVQSSFTQYKTSPTISGSVLLSTNQADYRGGRHRFHGHLVISSQDYHSAKGLCEHPNSFGPSFVSIHESLFCDMIEKKLYPTCKQSVEAINNMIKERADESCCFSIDERVLKGCSNSISALNIGTGISEDVRGTYPSGVPKTETYTSIQHW